MAPHDDRQFFVSREGRELSDYEAELLREIDEIGERLRELVTKVSNAEPGKYYELSQARSDLQCGLMWLRRVASRTSVF